MPYQLPADCLNEIFEYLDDEVIFNSCLLVNHLWCEVSVQILWKNIRNYNTLIACLPNKSKEILSKNKIIISTTTSKPPLFNYVPFIKNLSINEIIDNVKKDIVIQEIFKMLMSQTSLKRLDRCYPHYNLNNHFLSNTPFTYPGAIDCLKNLTELNCYSNFHSESLYQLSQTCHNLQSLKIYFQESITDGLEDLISVQQNLKYLCLDMRYYDKNLTITKLPNTLIKLDLFGKDNCTIPLSFIAKFTNLQEIGLGFGFYNNNCFEKLQYAIFPQLHTLKFMRDYPKDKKLAKFIENNGRSLEKLYFEDCYKTSILLNSAIAKFCSNLKSLYTTFINDKDESETLKVILNNCQQLESIKIVYDDYFADYYHGMGEYYFCLTEERLLEIVAKYSPKSFYKLKIYYEYGAHSKLFSEKLESFFINWTNRIPQKPVSLITISEYNSKSFVVKEENIKVIEKYIKLGVIKKFKTKEV